MIGFARVGRWDGTDRRLPAVLDDCPQRLHRVVPDKHGDHDDVVRFHEGLFLGTIGGGVSGHEQLRRFHAPGRNADRVRHRAVQRFAVLPLHVVQVTLPADSRKARSFRFDRRWDQIALRNRVFWKAQSFNTMMRSSSPRRRQAVDRS